MRHLKEPAWVDFIVESEPLTENSRLEIKRFIENYKGEKVIKKQVKNHTEKTRKAIRF